MGIYSNPVPTVTHKVKFMSLSAEPQVKQLPQEVKVLLPADQTNLKDGSQATPTQPSQRGEVKTAEVTWSFKSYDVYWKQLPDQMLFIGTWEFTATPVPRALIK